MNVHAFIFGLAFVAMTGTVYAQGGPPFRTDDPGTPGDRHWEVNIGLIGDRKPSEGSYSVPNIDFNYGLGDRIQLKYELPFALQESRGAGGKVIGGVGNSLLGVKYRFYEHRSPSTVADPEPNFAISLYPQLIFNNRTRSVSKEIVEPGPQFLLPIEAAGRIGPVKIVAETGYWFTRGELSNSWIRGLLIGHEFRKGKELYFELYDQADVRAIGAGPKLRETTLGIGGRRPITRTGSMSSIGMVGRSIANATPDNGQPRWIAYVGVQFLLGSNE